MRNGRGFERYPNNNSYFGFFQNGKAHGKGVYTWNNGEVYDGEWD
jgi:radial spoke head protein 1